MLSQQLFMNHPILDNLKDEKDPKHPKKTRPDTRQKMRLVCVLSTFKNNWGRTDRPTDGRTDTTSSRDAMASKKQ